MSRQELEVKLSLLGFTPTGYPADIYYQKEVSGQVEIVVNIRDKRVYRDTRKLYKAVYPTYAALYDAIKAAL